MLAGLSQQLTDLRQKIQKQERLVQNVTQPQRDLEALQQAAAIAEAELSRRTDELRQLGSERADLTLLIDRLNVALPDMQAAERALAALQPIAEGGYLAAGSASVFGRARAAIAVAREHHTTTVARVASIDKRIKELNQ